MAEVGMKGGDNGLVEISKDKQLSPLGDAIDWNKRVKGELWPATQTALARGYELWNQLSRLHNIKKPLDLDKVKKLRAEIVEARQTYVSEMEKVIKEIANPPGSIMAIYPLEVIREAPKFFDYLHSCTVLEDGELPELLSFNKLARRYSFTEEKLLHALDPENINQPSVRGVAHHGFSIPERLAFLADKIKKNLDGRPANSHANIDLYMKVSPACRAVDPSVFYEKMFWPIVENSIIQELKKVRGVKPLQKVEVSVDIDEENKVVVIIEAPGKERVERDINGKESHESAQERMLSADKQALEEVMGGKIVAERDPSRTKTLLKISIPTIKKISKYQQW